MKVPVRTLDTSGTTAEDIAERLIGALADGLVLLHRQVRAGTGIDAKRLSQNWVAVRPVIENGLIVELREDERTAVVNRVGRYRYGLRPQDVQKRLLRPVCPDAYCLGPAGMLKAAEGREAPPADMWDMLRPCALNHVPARDGLPARDQNVGTEPARALSNVARGDRDAIAALLEGLHLVDVPEPVEAGGRRSDKRTWRPMRPVLDEAGRAVGYQTDARVLRHTVNAGRYGFSPKTFAAVSLLLVDSGYRPNSVDLGHAYRLSDEWTSAAREAIGWAPEIDSAMPQDRPQSATDTVAPEPTGRQSSILAMLAGLPFDPIGDAPSHSEVGEAIAFHGGSPQRAASLIAAALAQATAAKRTRFRWFGR